jgi:hypothetical protein
MSKRQHGTEFICDQDML